MFMVCAMIYIIAGLVAFFIDYEKSEDYQRKQLERQILAGGGESGEYSGIWKYLEKKAFPAAVNNTIYFSSIVGLLVFLSIYARDVLLMDTNQISMFYIVTSATMIVVRLFSGKVADTYGVLMMIVPGHIAAILMLLMLGLWVKQNFILFMLAAVLYGIGSASIQPNLSAVAITDSPRGRSSAANALYFFMMDFGAMAATVCFGPVIDRAATVSRGYVLVYLISAGLCCASLLISVLFLNDKARAKRLLSINTP